mmetsp:Transcript_21663/g.35082  ORF Transcript_21663/g.35082 Transcript_21663/m.35082 type:complete len:212 (-) Transcript_21663:310-945(-)
MTVGRSEPAKTCVVFLLRNVRSVIGCVPSDNLFPSPNAPSSFTANVKSWPSPRPASRYDTPSNAHRSTARGITSAAARGAEDTRRRSGRDRTHTSMDHSPTAHSDADCAPGSLRGLQSRHAISCPSSTVASTRSEPDATACTPGSPVSIASPAADPAARLTKVPPVVASNTWVRLAAATLTDAPSGGTHVARSAPVFASTRRAPLAVTCSM